MRTKFREEQERKEKKVRELNIPTENACATNGDVSAHGSAAETIAYGANRIYE